MFLDVQMPQMNGFEVIDAVGPERMPLVIFVTAYDQHALQAFQVRALDYILKPFDRERFTEALRARASRSSATRPAISAAAARAGEGPAQATSRNRALVVKSAAGCSSCGWTRSTGSGGRQLRPPPRRHESHLLRETMNAIEGRLDPEKFFRIHRSRIVNMERIQEMQPWLNGEYTVVLRTGTRLTLSRGYREKLQERLGKGVWRNSAEWNTRFVNLLLRL